MADSGQITHQHGDGQHGCVELHVDHGKHLRDLVITSGGKQVPVDLMAINSWYGYTKDIRTFLSRFMLNKFNISYTCKPSRNLRI